jgi:hypothetical protein
MDEFHLSVWQPSVLVYKFQTPAPPRIGLVIQYDEHLSIIKLGDDVRVVHELPSLVAYGLRKVGCKTYSLGAISVLEMQNLIK